MALTAFSDCVAIGSSYDTLSSSGQCCLALNGGRDLAHFDEIARSTLLSGNRVGQDNEFNRHRVDIPARIDATALRPKLGTGGTEKEGLPGSDWSSLGGNRSGEGRQKWALPGFDELSSPVLTGAGLLLGGSFTNRYIEAYRSIRLRPLRSFDE